MPRLTLLEWLLLHNLTESEYLPSGTRVVVAPSPMRMGELFYLTDYDVISTDGLKVWLRPKIKPNC